MCLKQYNITVHNNNNIVLHYNYARYFCCVTVTTYTVYICGNCIVWMWSAQFVFVGQCEQPVLPLYSPSPSPFLFLSFSFFSLKHTYIHICFTTPILHKQAMRPVIRWASRSSVAVQYLRITKVKLLLVNYFTTLFYTPQKNRRYGH